MLTARRRIGGGIVALVIGASALLLNSSFASATDDAGTNVWTTVPVCSGDMVTNSDEWKACQTTTTIATVTPIQCDYMTNSLGNECSCPIMTTNSTDEIQACESDLRATITCNADGVLVTVEIVDSNADQNYQGVLLGLKSTAVATKGGYALSWKVPLKSGQSESIQIRGGKFGLNTQKVVVSGIECGTSTSTTIPSTSTTVTIGSTVVATTRAPAPQATTTPSPSTTRAPAPQATTTTMPCDCTSTTVAPTTSTIATTTTTPAVSTTVPVTVATTLPVTTTTIPAATTTLPVTTTTKPATTSTKPVTTTKPNTTTTKPGSTTTKPATTTTKPTTSSSTTTTVPSSSTTIASTPTTLATLGSTTPTTIAQTTTTVAPATTTATTLAASVTTRVTVTAATGTTAQPTTQVKGQSLAKTGANFMALIFIAIGLGLTGTGLVQRSKRNHVVLAPVARQSPFWNERK